MSSPIRPPAASLVLTLRSPEVRGDRPRVGRMLFWAAALLIGALSLAAGSGERAAPCGGGGPNAAPLWAARLM
jgi:hypothetical protein